MAKKNRSDIDRILLTSILLGFTVFSPTFLFCEETAIIQRESPSAPPQDDYLLAPSDEIEIKVAGEEDLSGIYKIDNDGNITFPILGKVYASDMTLAQVEGKIAKQLEKDYFKTRVSLRAEVKKFHKRKVIISGEIARPGYYEFDEDKNMSLVELISLAGGPTEKACMNVATIMRPEGEGKTKTIKIRAGDIMEGKEKDIILDPGDRVKIPRANVIVMGEVVKPGTYGFGEANKMTLLSAISMAGGFTRIAAINSVKIIRMDEFGNKKKIKVNVANIYNGREKDVPLEPYDIIVVPESWF